MGVRIVGKGFDDAAFSDSATPAAPDHTSQFRSQGEKPRDLSRDLRKMGGGDTVGPLAGLIGPSAEREQFTDVIKRKAEFARMADEGKPLTVLGSVHALVARRALRLGHEAHSFVVADGLDLAARGSGQISNGKFHGEAPLNLQSL